MIGIQFVFIENKLFVKSVKDDGSASFSFMGIYIDDDGMLCFGEDAESNPLIWFDIDAGGNPTIYLGPITQVGPSKQANKIVTVPSIIGE